jgi:hypothetical protein
VWGVYCSVTVVLSRSEFVYPGSRWRKRRMIRTSTAAPFCGGGRRKCVNRRFCVSADDQAIKVLRIGESKSREGLPQIHVLISGVSGTQSTAFGLLSSSSSSSSPTTATFLASQRFNSLSKRFSLTDQALLTHCSAKNFPALQHILSLLSALEYTNWGGDWAVLNFRVIYLW